VSLLALTACTSPEDKVHTHLDDWYSTASRYAWSCDAMGEMLERWLERNEAALRDDVMAVQNLLPDLEDSERAVLLREVGGGARIEAGRNAIAGCSDHEAVARANATMVDVLLPLLLYAPVPIPPEPAPDTTE